MQVNIPPRVKLTMSFPADLHGATTALAREHRRSFTQECCVALDEHLAANGITPAPTEPDVLVTAGNDEE